MPRSRRGPASYTQASSRGARERRERVERRGAAVTDLDLLRIAGVAVIAAKLAVVPVVFDPLGEDAFGVVKSAVSRGLLYLLLCVGALYIAMSPFGRDRLRGSRWITLGSLAFAGISAIATLLAVDQRTALFGAHHRYLGLTSTLDGVALAMAFPLFLRDRRDLVTVLAGLFGGALIVIAYAVVQIAGLDPFSWQDPTVASTIGNRGFFAGYLVVIVAAALAVASALRSATRTVVLALLALGSALLVLLSGARGPVLALPLAVLAAAAFALRAAPAVFGGWRHRRVAVAALLAFAALSAVAITAAPRVKSLLAGDSSIAERALVYQAAFQMLRERPFVGAGPDHFAVLYPRVRPTTSAEVSAVIAPGQSSAHSWPLHHAVGTGSLGFVAWASLVAVGVARAWLLTGTNGGAGPIAGAMLCAFLFQGVFNAPDVVTSLLFWTAVGLAAVGPLEPQALPFRVRSIRSMFPVGAILVVGVGLSLTTLSWVLANRDVQASDLFRLSGKRDVAEGAALFATQRDPGRANNWNVLGLAREGRPDAAAAAFARAVELAPYESVYLLNLARQEALLAERQVQRAADARAHARRASEVDPISARTQYALSQVLAILGDLEAALVAAERAIALQPTAGNYDWAALVYADLGRPADAIARLRSKEAILFPDGKLPLDERLRLAQLYVASGDVGSARALFAPPAATGADPNCEPTFGSARLGASLVRPRCIRFVFEIEAPLLAEGTKPGSAVDPAAYTIGGAPLPRGSTASYDGKRFVMVQLPAGELPPEPRTRIVVRGVTDIYGNPIRPDPGQLTMQ